MTTLLFAYGTLAPTDPADRALGGWAADRVRGRLYDLGPYPALVDLGDPAAGLVRGFVRAVGSAELDGPLDQYEGVAEGLYSRKRARTAAGRLVWVYVYGRPLPPGAVGPIDRWTRLVPDLERGRGAAAAGSPRDFRTDRPGDDA